MRIDWRAVAAALGPALLPGLTLLLAAALLMAERDAAERQALWAAIEPDLPLLGIGWFGLTVLAGWLGHRAWLRFGAPMGKMAEDVQVVASGDVDRELPIAGSAGARALASAVNSLVRERRATRTRFEERVRQAAHHVDEERERLAALMSELSRSVVVCNLDGRILLYNNRARLQFRALSDAPTLAGGAELIGLGRSIYAVMDRDLVAHALERVRRRMANGAAHPHTQFVTGTRSGQLLRVQLAPVRASSPAVHGAVPGDPAVASASASAGIGIAGFVLMLDNITQEYAHETARDRMLHALTEASRASLGALQAAVEILDDPQLNADTRARFQSVVREEVAAMSQRIQDLATHTTQTVKTRWPLEPMLGADLVETALRRIGIATTCRAGVDDVDEGVWLNVDSFSLVEVLTGLVQRLVDEHEVRHVRLRLGVDTPATQPRARLDLMWIGRSMSTESVGNWETDTLRIGGESLPLTVRDVVERHGGAFWFERERVRQAAFFRFLLPLADAGSESIAAEEVSEVGSRPEYYDFDLFRQSEQTQALADRRLRDLTFTVFDTETTGLQPAGGDEIIQIGATRIVAGRLRRQEVFEQLVDPKRHLPEAGIAIHGIRPEMLVGQPTIDTVLPAFHAFARDSVLVAHNAAFDMRFLQLKEASSGVVFDQPVLDTLLLSPILHPNQDGHGLESIAERLGVSVLGRHTALGDAMVTAEAFLKMIPLLEAMGIRTLGQAIDASRQSLHAKVTY